jgi:hypothetical protein
MNENGHDEAWHDAGLKIILICVLCKNGGDYV